MESETKPDTSDVDIPTNKDPCPVQKSIDKEESSDHPRIQLDKETLEKLSLGLLQNFLPEFQKSQATLSELTENQRILIETIQQENTKFGECQALTELTDHMEKAKNYHAKMINIKKEMTHLHERSSKIKKRAVKLQVQKEKEALQKELKIEHQRNLEKKLIARPARSKSEPS